MASLRNVALDQVPVIMEATTMVEAIIASTTIAAVEAITALTFLAMVLRFTKVSAAAKAAMRSLAWVEAVTTTAAMTKSMISLFRVEIPVLR
jgi:uncharacterized MAPEG superfamily protein